MLELKVIDLRDIWPGLFAGLHECEHIHFPSGIITESKISDNTRTNFYGLVSEEAQL